MPFPLLPMTPFQGSAERKNEVIDVSRFLSPTVDGIVRNDEPSSISTRYFHAR